MRISQRILLGNIKPKRDYIHTRDIADAILAICEKSIRGYDVFNIGTGKEYSVEEIIHKIEAILGKSIKITQVKKRMRDVERMHLCADIRKIKKIIGWAPQISFTEAIQDIASYYGVT